MASLKKRVQRLEKDREEGCAFLIVYEGETTEAVWKKYLAKHPEAEKAEVVMFVKAAMPRPSEDD